MDAAIIINPVAGSRRRTTVESRVAIAREALREHGADGQVAVTNGRGHARELAHAMVEQGTKTVVAWGGDGTVNEVASALAFHETVLGIVPAGSGNGLATELGLPLKDPVSALRIALDGPSRGIDAGELGGHLFFNVAGVGLDAHLAAVFNQSARRGLIGYVTATLTEIATYEAGYYVLRASDVAISQTALMVVLANTRQYGNNALIAPLARPDDGLLELVVVPPLSPLAALWKARHLFNGTAHEVPGVTRQAVRQVEIVSDAMPQFHVDGEVMAAPDVVAATVHPRALQVRVAGRAA